MDLKIVKTVKVYLRKKDRETALKKQEERINAIVKSIVVGKTPKEAIQMFFDIEELFNEKMDEQLREGIEAVEVITKYKKL